MKGYHIFTPEADPEGRRWLFPSETRLQYSDSVIDPDNLNSTRGGRTGLAFVTMALISLYYTSKMFVPKGSSSNDTNVVNWKRGNLVCSSVVMSLFLVVLGALFVFVCSLLSAALFLSVLCCPPRSCCPPFFCCRCVSV